MQTMFAWSVQDGVSSAAAAAAVEFYGILRETDSLQLMNLSIHITTPQSQSQICVHKSQHTKQTQSTTRINTETLLQHYHKYTCRVQNQEEPVSSVRR